MPPKIRITREKLVYTAVDIVRREGINAVNARAVAKKLGCSTQPVFSNFATMEELRCAVLSAADELYEEYIDREIAAKKYPAYKASGMAYIRFAGEEKELFRLLFMRDRSHEDVNAETEGVRKIVGIVQESTGLDEKRARLFHLEMWAFVHGIAAMTATGFLELDTELISEMMTDAYQGLIKHYRAKE